MEYIPAKFGVNDVRDGFVVDIGSLYDFLSRLKDHRDARGVRYKLVNMLVFIACQAVGRRQVDRHLRMGVAQAASAVRGSWFG